MSKMSREDKIKLYELLTDYMREIKADQKTYGECTTKEELAVQMMISKHIQAIKEIEEVLCFDF